MSSFKIFDIAGSGMNAQNLRMNLVASNLANVDAVSSSTDATYRARQPVFQAVLDRADSRNPAVGVRMVGVVESERVALLRSVAPSGAPIVAAAIASDDEPSEWQQEVQALMGRLLEGIPAEPSDRSPNEQATWLPDLKPALGADRFFFEDEYQAMQLARGIQLR